VTHTQRQIEANRQGDASIQVRDSSGQPRVGVSVWAEQETHAFVFGCIAPAWEGLSEADRDRGTSRLHELFNRLLPPAELVDPGVVRVEVPDGIHLGVLRVQLDRLSKTGLPLEVHVRGQSAGLGLDERAAAKRTAELYTLCFAYRAVQGLVWHGAWDGEEGVAGSGLLRMDCAPRPAYRYLHKLIHTIWHTRAAGQTDAAGVFHFRGFFGDYRIAARLGDAAATTVCLSCRPGGAVVVLRLAGGP
jgi:hypothetical protein